MSMAKPRKRKSREQLDEESAARHNARNARKWALWAAVGKVEDVAPAIDGKEVARRRQEVTDYQDLASEKTRLRAEAYRAAVAQLVQPSELADLDERRKRYPKGHEFTAVHFSTELARLTGRSPVEIFDDFKARVEHASDMVRPSDQAEADREIRAGLVAIAGRAAS